jgi:hypothetical protein
MHIFPPPLQFILLNVNERICSSLCRSPHKQTVSFSLTPHVHRALLASVKRKTCDLYFYLLNGKIHSLQVTRRVGFITRAYEGRVVPLPAACQESPISTEGVAVTSWLVFGKCLVQTFILTLGISNKCLDSYHPPPPISRRNCQGNATIRPQPFPSYSFQFFIYISFDASYIPLLTTSFK